MQSSCCLSKKNRREEPCSQSTTDWVERVWRSACNLCGGSLALYRISLRGSYLLLETCCCSRCWKMINKFSSSLSEMLSFFFLFLLLHPFHARPLGREWEDRRVIGDHLIRASIHEWMRAKAGQNRAKDPSTPCSLLLLFFSSLYFSPIECYKMREIIFPNLSARALKSLPARSSCLVKRVYNYPTENIYI